ncbi:Quinic acid utilization activator [Hyphodiscus hymeniophilus]|uniref:Quinic acid utilization activator n=1 Tax=Hyphodiscus hymeniophilus TaxID=353542 RepID=A0A9P6VC55_9HELO|nr:Quinic acid utilization activator [Hyphodiscus hymeniophilus]
MDSNGLPDSKRLRIVGPLPGPPPPPAPWNSSRERDLPPVPQTQPPTPSAPQYQQHGPSYARQPEHQTNPLDAHRRHSAHSDHRTYDQDTRRPSSGPSPHAFHQHQPGAHTPTHLPPYGVQQDVIMKREPVEDVQYRPASTGSAPDHNMMPTHAESRHPQQLPPFEMAGHPRTQSYQATPSYVPQSPMPGNEPYGHPGYGPPGLPPPRQDYVAYPTPIAAAQKRKAQRAAQACDSCRSLKAKCDEGRPNCSSCKEKSIACVYRDPPPKQQDRTAAEIVEAINRMDSNMAKFQGTISDRLSRVESALFPTRRVADDSFRGEPDDSRAAADFQIPPRRVSSAQASGRLPGPPPLMTAAFDAPPSLGESPFPSNSSQQPASEMAVDMAETIEEDEDGPPVNPGQPSIPVNHTTGAARLLLNRAIKELAGGVIKSDRIKNENYPMLQEERRGLLKLFGRGEGTDRLPGYDKDPLTDVAEGSTLTPSDASSDVGSPDENWGQLGGLTPPGDVVQRGSINHEGMPEFNSTVVKDLVHSYMQHINIMHPILVPAQLHTLVDNFLRTIPTDHAAKPKQVLHLTSHSSVQNSHSAGFVGAQSNRNPDSPSNKRKWSPTQGEPFEQPNVPDHKPGQPFRSIGTAIVLLVMALGEICQEKGKIRDCVPAHDGENSWGSPAVRNGHPSPSGLHSSPSMSTVSGLPSPIDGERIQSRSRRTSIEGIHPARNTSGTRLKNLDVVPGLKYFAFATDILGNQAGGNSLQHVHANILASLYHGQLGRPLESHAYLHQACRSLQVILRPKLDRFKRLKENPRAQTPARDNHLIIAFWTCLQLESDIVAELPVPHSGILTYEEDMPSLNLHAAVEIDKIDIWHVTSYAAQLAMRKHLNQLHNMFYKPQNDSEFPSVFSGKRPPPFKTIDASLENLEDIKRSLPSMHWDDDDAPATEILRARFRAKYYGAKVITYRPFLEKVLEHSSTQKAKQRIARDSVQESPQLIKRQEGFSQTYKKEVIDVPTINPDAASFDDNDRRIKDYAINGISALIQSTKAFHGLGDPGKQRLIVTNVWGTAHAQWGNLITLLAASIDPILGPLMPKQELRDLYEKTMGFLKLVAQPSSALYIDIKILEHVAKEIDLIPKQASSSFSSASGDVPMTGH